MLYLGIDIGGTKISGVLWEQKSQKILKSTRIKTASQSTPLIKESLLKMARELDVKKTKGIGVSVAGPIDKKKGTLLHLPNIPSLRQFPLKKFLEKEFSLPIVLERDSHCFLMGEMPNIFNCSENILGIVWGTGLGGTLWIKKQFYQGATGNALEIGHMIVEKNGLLCGCGNRGCLEKYISGPAMEKSYQKLTGQNLALPAIYEKFKQGEKEASQIIEKTEQIMSDILISLVNILNPHKIILGGGVSHLNYWFEKFTPAIQNRSFSQAKKVELQKGKQDEASAVGAAVNLAHLKTS